MRDLIGCIVGGAFFQMQVGISSHKSGGVYGALASVTRLPHLRRYIGIEIAAPGIQLTIACTVGTPSAGSSRQELTGSPSIEPALVSAAMTVPFDIGQMRRAYSRQEMNSNSHQWRG